MQVSRDDNFTVCVSHTFISSIIRYRIDNDEDAVDCIRFQCLLIFNVSTSFDEHLPRCMKQDYLLIVTARLLYIILLYIIIYYLLFIIYY